MPWLRGSTGPLPPPSQNLNFLSVSVIQPTSVLFTFTLTSVQNHALSKLCTCCSQMIPKWLIVSARALSPWCSPYYST